MTLQFPALFHEIGVTGFVDILCVATLIYGLLAWFKYTKRAAFVLTGILFVAAIYLLAQHFEMRLTVTVLQGFFAVILVALVVIFQEELRHLFEQIAQWGLGRLSLHHAAKPRLPDVEMLLRTTGDLARDRVGALIVLRGRDLLVRHLEGGEPLGGRVGEAMLKSLFDPNSIGHDGAVVVEGETLTRFGCHLPLSKKNGGHSGTRHAAALGLSERTDALCLVVSEERGTISVARHGELRIVTDPMELRGMLEGFFAEIAPVRPVSWHRFLTANLREKVAALLLAVALWFVLVHESRVTFATFRVPVTLAGPALDPPVLHIDPPLLEVTFSGPRKSLYFVTAKRIRVALPTWALEPGENHVPVAPTYLSFPPNLVLENYRPLEVAVIVGQPPAPGGP